MLPPWPRRDGDGMIDVIDMFTEESRRHLAVAAVCVISVVISFVRLLVSPPIPTYPLFFPRSPHFPTNSSFLARARWSLARTIPAEPWTTKTTRSGPWQRRVQHVGMDNYCCKDCEGSCEEGLYPSYW